MDAPVDKDTASGDGLGGEGPAQAGNAAIGAEADIHLIHLAQLAAAYVVTDAVHTVVETVDHPDIQYLAGFMLGLLHLERLGIGAGRGLLAQHVFPSPQAVNGDGRVHVVGGAHRHRLHRRVLQDSMIVRYRLAAAACLDGLFRTLGQNIAKIGNFRLLVFHVGRNMRAVRNGPAPDNRHFHWESSFLQLTSLK